MVNYLLRLGWSHGDEEIISREDAMAWFGLDRVGKAPARFDMDKLADINSHYLRAMDDGELWALVAPLVTPTSPNAEERVTKLMPLLKDRADRLTLSAQRAPTRTRRSAVTPSVTGVSSLTPW